MKKFLAVICSFILITTLCCGVILLEMTEFVSKKHIEKVVSNININDLLKDSDIHAESTYEVFTNLGIPREKVDELFNSKGVKDLLSNAINNTLDYYIREGKSSQVLTEEQLDTFLKEFIITCSDKSNLHLTSEQEQFIYDFAKPSLKELEENLPTLEEIQQEDPEVAAVITYSKFILGPKLKVACILLLVLSALAIYFLRKEGYLIWYGVDTIIASGLLFIFFHLLKLLFSVDMLGTEFEDISILIEPLITKGFMHTALIFVIGILLIITHKVIKKKKQREQIVEA